MPYVPGYPRSVRSPEAGVAGIVGETPISGGHHGSLVVGTPARGPALRPRVRGQSASLGRDRRCAALDHRVLGPRHAGSLVPVVGRAHCNVRGRAIGATTDVACLLYTSPSP